MPRNLTQRQLLALETGFKDHIFIEMDHPDGFVRAWTGTGLLEQDSSTVLEPVIDETGMETMRVRTNPDPVKWIGMGDLLEIRGLEQERDFVLTEVEMIVSAIPVSAIRNLNRDVRGRRARVHIGILNDQRQIIDHLINVTVITLDRTEVEQTSSTATIKLIGTAGITSMDKPIRRVISKAYQELKYPNVADSGFDFIPQLQDFQSDRRWSPGEYRGVT